MRWKFDHPLLMITLHGLERSIKTTVCVNEKLTTQVLLNTFDSSQPFTTLNNSRQLSYIMETTSYMTSTSSKQLLEANKPVFEAETIEEDNMAFVPTYRLSPRQHVKMIGEVIASWRSPTPEHASLRSPTPEHTSWRSPTPEPAEVADFLDEDDMAWGSHTPREVLSTLRRWRRN